MKKLEDYLMYEQPTKYIVESENYSDKYNTPVLTAGKSFVLGYTNETTNIFPKEKLPIILFDDFTTECKYVDFPFKVKSSAIKILHPKENSNPKFLYYYMKNIKFDSNLHKRYWISEYSKILIKDVPLEKQNDFANKVSKIEKLIEIKKQQINLFNEVIRSKFLDMSKDINKYPQEELKNNVIEMFIGPFGSALKNECFVSRDKSSCVVYEQKHAINKYIGDFRYVDNAKHNELKRFEILPNDIIISCRGTIGETYIIPENAPLGIMHPSIMKIRLNLNKYNPTFFNEIIKQYLNDNIGKTNGGTIKMGIKASDLEKIKFIRPSLSEQNNFLEIKKKIDKQKLLCQDSIDYLENLKISLMREYVN